MSFNEKQEDLKYSDGAFGEVDLVIVWPEKWAADIFAELIRKKHSKKVDIYYSCDSFLQDFKRYPKNIKVCFNYTLENGKTGPQIAEIIYSEGYTNVYLYTAYDVDYLKEQNIPNYLTVLFKADTVGTLKTLLG